METILLFDLVSKILITTLGLITSGYITTLSIVLHKGVRPKDIFSKIEIGKLIWGQIYRILLLISSLILYVGVISYTVKIGDVVIFEAFKTHPIPSSVLAALVFYVFYDGFTTLLLAPETARQFIKQVNKLGLLEKAIEIGRMVVFLLPASIIIRLLGQTLFEKLSNWLLRKYIKKKMDMSLKEFLIESGKLVIVRILIFVLLFFILV